MAAPRFSRVFRAHRVGFRRYDLVSIAFDSEFAARPVAAGDFRARDGFRHRFSARQRFAAAVAKYAASGFSTGGCRGLRRGVVLVVFAARRKRKSGSARAPKLDAGARLDGLHFGARCRALALCFSVWRWRANPHQMGARPPISPPNWRRKGRTDARAAIPRLLEYWGGQQKTPRLPGRHDYYVVLSLLYEVPILICGIGGVVARGQKSLARSTIFWCGGRLASWAVYAVANEKVPWLLVHMALPFALLGGVWLGSLRMPRLAWATLATCGLLFSLRGDSAMIFERAGDNAEPIFYAQTPDDIPRRAQSGDARNGGRRTRFVDGRRTPVAERVVFPRR